MNEYASAEFVETTPSANSAPAAVSVARLAVDSVTSQFFINLVDNDFLNFRAPTPQYYGYAVFGKVTDGMDVVDKIAKVKTGFAGPHQNVPEEPIVIKKVHVAAEPAAPQAPAKKE